MTEGSNHINYTATDIERYWKGELSPPQQHAMEKAALDDPFLADAMEGYADTHRHEKILQERLGELENDLDKRIHRKDNRSVIALGWWRIAAMVVVVAGAGWLAIRLNRNNEPNEIAQEKAKKQAPAAAVEKTDSPQLVQTDSITLNLKETASSYHTTQPTPPRKKTAVAKQETNEEPAAAVVAADKAKDDETRQNEVVTTKPAEAEKKEAAPSAVSIGNARASTFNKPTGERATSDFNAGESNSNRFSASLVDKYNQPLQNVKVSIPAFNVETKTDKKGNFSFFAPDSIVNVNVSTSGYMPQFINLTKEATLNQITLDPYPKDRGKMSAVADGKGIPVTDSTKRITLQVLDAEPLTGFTAFQEYLAKNKRIPFGKKDVHGTVIVSFDVHPHSISNFEIMESLDDELDEEAVRLVKAGPGWRLLKGKKASIKLNIQF